MMKSYLGSMAIVALVLGAGCAGESERTSPEARAQRALKDANLADVDLNWSVDTSVLRLQGSVETAADRSRAEQLASEAVGTSGRVLNELTVDDPAYYQPDNTQGSLHAKLENTMAAEFGSVAAYGSGDKYDISFDIADNGAVTIKGRVDSKAKKERVGMLVRSTQGVTGVVNNLEIVDPVK